MNPTSVYLVQWKVLYFTPFLLKLSNFLPLLFGSWVPPLCTVCGPVKGFYSLSSQAFQFSSIHFCIMNPPSVYVVKSKVLLSFFRSPNFPLFIFLYESHLCSVHWRVLLPFLSSLSIFVRSFLLHEFSLSVEGPEEALILSSQAF